MLLCFHACAIYTCSHVEKQRFTCFCAFGLCCVYLRSREGYQKSRYAVYVCFYIFQESQVAVCTCFYVFLDPAEAQEKPNRGPERSKDPPQSPPEAQDKPNRGPERSIEPLRVPPEAPGHCPETPEAQQKPNRDPQGPHTRILSSF